MEKYNQRSDIISVARKYFKESDFGLQERRGVDHSAFIIRLPASPVPSVLFYVCIDNDGLCKINGYLVSDLEGEKLVRGIQIANTLNCKYRFFKNLIDEDGDYDLRYEMMLSDKEDEIIDQLSGIIYLLMDYLKEVIPIVFSLIAEDI